MAAPSGQVGLSIPIALTGGSAPSSAMGGTLAGGNLSMNQPFIVGGQSASNTPSVTDSYAQVLVPAAIAMLALVIWLK